MSVSLFKKYIVSTFVIFIIAFLLEIFVFNFSSFRTGGLSPVLLEKDMQIGSGQEYFTEPVELNCELKNIHANIDMTYGDLVYVSLILTDEGDKYEYSTPEFVVCNGIPGSGYCNIYPFGKAKTVIVKIWVPDGSVAYINDITLNDRKPIDIKPLRILALFFVFWLGYMIFADTFFHRIYLDTSKKWQLAVILVFILFLIIGAYFINHADKVILASHWPHHKQYQELARSLEKGSVVLSEQYVDPALLEVENPYDTLALQVEDITYSMDCAFYDGNYYTYFGIVPELLMYFPYHLITGRDFPNYWATYFMFVIFIFGAFFSVAGFIRRYFRKVPFVLYLLISSAIVLGANFLYLVERSDIYNVPIISGIAFTFLGLGFWLEAVNTQRVWLRRASIVLGSLSMALVAGCRPQLVILSFASIFIFMIRDNGEKRGLFTKETLTETICFILPYVIVAIPVCWYNAARFGSIFDFGAGYSLTTNDMNKRGFNFNRLFRSLYSFLFQPAVLKTDFPFMLPSVIEGNYMGKYMVEYIYGGIIVANTFMASIWLMLLNGFRKIDAKIKALAIFLIGAGTLVAAFDANEAGVIYRYTCDFAPLFFLAATLLWLVLVSENGKEILSYSFAAHMLYVCIVLSVVYSFLTIIASGNTVCLENDNTPLFYWIADYFSF